MNIAEILKYCPKGTKLYSTVFGEVKFSKINPDDMIVIIIKDNSKRVFRKDGSYSEYGECVLFPSKDQRNWSKFRLPVKRGDIMMDANGECPFIATGELHHNISPKYICGVDITGHFSTGIYGWTSEFYIPASEEAKKELFDKMVEAGYKWNADTLELETIESTFKEGDVVIDDQGNLCLVSKIRDDGFITIAAALYTSNILNVYTSNTVTRYSQLTTIASTTNRNKLYSALVREGYRYDEKQHRLVKQEFKPFDKVLIRDEDNQTWRICLFSHYRKDLPYPYVCVGCSAYTQCIPYKGNEYLLDTTDSPA